MFCSLYFSLRTDHVLSSSMFLCYLNNPIAFVILVADLIYKEKQLVTSISSHTETLGSTFCIFLRLSQVEAAEGKCSSDKHLWMVGKDTIISGANPITYPVDRGRGLVPFTMLYSYFHLPPIFRNPPSEPKSFIRPLVKHLLFANLFFPQTPAPFCVCANVRMSTPRSRWLFVRQRELMQICKLFPFVKCQKNTCKSLALALSCQLALLKGGDKWQSIKQHAFKERGDLFQNCSFRGSF